MSTETVEVGSQPMREQSRKGSLRNAMRTLNIAFWIGISCPTLSWGNLVMTQLAKMVNMTPFGFGLLSSIGCYGQLSQLISSYLVERFGHRKRFYILFGIVYGSLLFVIGLLPLLAPISFAWKAVLVISGISFFFWFMCNPPANSWVGDLIPQRIIGRWCAFRMQVSYLIGLISMLGVGYALDAGQQGGMGLMKSVVIGLFLLGAVLGTTEYLICILVPDPPTHFKKPSIRFISILVEPFKNRDFRFFTAYHVMYRASQIFIAQFAFLYLIDIAKMSNTKIMLLTTAIPTLGFTVVAGFWGRLIDRIGYRPVYIFSTVMYSLQAIWFILVSQDSWILGFSVGLLGILFMPAIDIGTSVYMLKISSSKNKNGLNTAYTAIWGVTLAVAGIVSGIIAGAMANYLGRDWQTTVHGCNLTFHGIIFITAGVLRLSGIFWAIALEPNKQLTNSQIVSGIYEQLRADLNTILAWLTKLARRG